MFMLAHNPCLEIFHLPKLKHYAPLNNNLPFPFIECPRNHLYSFCKFDNSQYLIWVESYSSCLFVTGLFHLA